MEKGWPVGSQNASCDEGGDGRASGGGPGTLVGGGRLEGGRRGGGGRGWRVDGGGRLSCGGGGRRAGGGAGSNAPDPGRTHAPGASLAAVARGPPSLSVATPLVRVPVGAELPAAQAGKAGSGRTSIGRPPSPLPAAGRHAGVSTGRIVLT